MYHFLRLGLIGKNHHTGLYCSCELGNDKKFRLVYWFELKLACRRHCVIGKTSSPWWQMKKIKLLSTCWEIFGRDVCSRRRQGLTCSVDDENFFYILLWSSFNNVPMQGLKPSWKSTIFLKLCYKRTVIISKCDVVSWIVSELSQWLYPGYFPNDYGKSLGHAQITFKDIILEGYLNNV